MYENISEQGSNSGRPIYTNLSLTPFEKGAISVNIVVLCLHWAYVIWNYSDLPEEIPVHWNTSGEPDSYQGKGFIFLLPSMSLAAFILIWISANYPHKYNFPVPITPSNAKYQYVLARKFQRVVSAFLAFQLLILSNITISAIHNPSQTLTTFMVLFIIVPILILIALFFYYRSYARRFV